MKKDIILVLATFLNPVGYGELFGLLNHFTTSYWLTYGIFLGLSALLFTVYFFSKKY